MSRNYKFHNPEGLYFISFAVVGWLDVFIRNEYKDILLDCLRFCQAKKGMEIHAWCLMTSHVHLVFRSIEGEKPELLIGDFKRFTSKALVKSIIENPQESRKEILLNCFKKEAEKSSNVTHYQFWRHDNKPIELWSNHVIQEKINYIHQNPVEAGLVFRAEDYVYSSAIDYAGEKGLLENIIIFRMYGQCKPHERIRAVAGEINNESSFREVAIEIYKIINNGALPFFDSYSNLNHVFEETEKMPIEEMAEFIEQPLPQRRIVIKWLCKDKKYQEYVDMVIDYYKSEKDDGWKEIGLLDKFLKTMV